MVPLWDSLVEVIEVKRVSLIVMLGLEMRGEVELIVRDVKDVDWMDIVPDCE